MPKTLSDAVKLSQAFNKGFMSSQYVEASAQVTEVRGDRADTALAC
jgi:hypothetical protein